MTTLIVDVSQFGGVPDYTFLANEGAQGVIPRLCSGSRDLDTSIDRQLDAIDQVPGLRVPAAYQYIKSWHNGASMCRFALEEAEKRGLRFVVADTEPVMVGERQTDDPPHAREVVHDWLREHLLLTGRKGIVYGPASYLDQLHLDADLVGPLWIAAWGFRRPPRTRPWGDECALHQYRANAPGGKSGTAVDWNQTELTLEQLALKFAEFAGEQPAGWDASWARAVELSDRVAGRRPGGGAEAFEPTHVEDTLPPSG